MPPTQSQLKRLFALSRNAGLSPDDVKAIVRERYGHGSRRDLSDREYEELCVHLQEVTGDRAASGGLRKPGELADEMEILAWLQTEGLPWDPIATTEHDLTLMLTLLDDFRRYRAHYKRISVADARKWLGWMARHPLSLWRDAVDVWLSCYRTRNEKYFAGILRHMARDRTAVRRFAGSQVTGSEAVPQP